MAAGLSLVAPVLLNRPLCPAASRVRVVSASCASRPAARPAHTLDEGGTDRATTRARAREHTQIHTRTHRVPAAAQRRRGARQRKARRSRPGSPPPHTHTTRLGLATAGPGHHPTRAGPRPPARAAARRAGVRACLGAAADVGVGDDDVAVEAARPAATRQDTGRPLSGGGSGPACGDTAGYRPSLVRWWKRPGLCGAREARERALERRGAARALGARWGEGRLHARQGYVPARRLRATREKAVSQARDGCEPRERRL